MSTQQQQRHLSPDGKFYWDGTAWQPNTGQPNGAPAIPPNAPKKGMGAGKKFGLGCGTIAGLLVLLIIVVAATQGGKGSGSPSPAPSGSAVAATQAPKQPASNPGCQQPCATVNGVTVTVSDVKYGAPNPDQFSEPESGNVFVTMTLTFTNKSNSEYNVNPTNFVLKDGAGIKHMTDFTALGTAGLWEPVNLTTGATITKPIGFQATADKPSGLVLVWTPGLLSGDTNIKLS